MPVTNNAMIALMGATGTGKSSFILSLTSDKNIRVGHSQESQTDKVDISVYADPINKCSVTLIDTPGFDDSRDGVSDTDILQRIVDFLQANGGRRLNGIIYLHRISDPRMTGNMKKNLRMFCELCGESALKNVYIATTNWSRVTKEEGDMRERELRESPNSSFRPLLDAGAGLVRHDKGATSAQSIVADLIRKEPTKLQIQIELDDGKTLDETRAGALLKKEIKALAEKHEVEMRALRDEMEQAARDKEAKLLAELEEERETMERRRQKFHGDLRKLEQQTRRPMAERKTGTQALEEVPNARNEVPRRTVIDQEAQKPDTQHPKRAMEGRETGTQGLKEALRASQRGPSPRVMSHEAPKKQEAQKPGTQQPKHARKGSETGTQALEGVSRVPQKGLRPTVIDQEAPKKQKAPKLGIQQTKRAVEERETGTQALEASRPPQKGPRRTVVDQEAPNIQEAQKPGPENQKPQVRQDTTTGGAGEVQREQRKRRRRRNDKGFANGYMDRLEECVNIGHERLGIIGAVVGVILGVFVFGPLQGLKLAFEGK